MKTWKKGLIIATYLGLAVAVGGLAYTNYAQSGNAASDNAALTEQISSANSALANYAAALASAQAAASNAQASLYSAERALSNASATTEQLEAENLELENAIAAVNQITQSGVKSTVQIINTCATGSGVIYDEDSNYYYALTNNHVVYVCSSPSTFSVKTYDGDTETATLVARNANYDLAVVKFAKDSGNSDLVVSSLAGFNPTVGTYVYSVGYPEGQSNALTVGVVESYSAITLSKTSRLESNVTFPIIRHTAVIDSGSSGGPLFDASGKIVGLNYAGNDPDDAEDNYPYTFVEGFAIPIERINVFLCLYNLA